MIKLVIAVQITDLAAQQRALGAACEIVDSVVHRHELSDSSNPAVYRAWVETIDGDRRWTVYSDETREDRRDYNAELRNVHDELDTLKQSHAALHAAVAGHDRRLDDADSLRGRIGAALAFGDDA